MSMTLLKGAPAARALQDKLSSRIQACGKEICLAVIRVGDNPDDCSYERSILKKCEQLGIMARTVTLDAACTPKQLKTEVANLNEDVTVHGVIVMRPLPKHLEEVRIEELVSPCKDVDAMHPQNLAAAFLGENGFAPCTAEAVMQLLEHAEVTLKGKHAVVIGRSPVVGRPLAMLLLQRDATVTVCHSKTENLKELCKQADILVCAAGQAKMVDASYIKPGAVVMDVGIHVDAGGQLCGDVDRDAVGEKASLLTPVPGGVGTVTGWILMEHVVRAAEEQA